MLHHPLIDQLQQLKLSGMLAALEQQLSMSDRDQLSFDERLGLLLEHEMTVRANRRLQYRLQKAKLRQAACIEDIDYRHPRGLDKLLVQQLISCRWLDEHLNCLITGPTGLGRHTGRKNMAGVCLSPTILPSGLYRAVPAPAPAAARFGVGPRRWTLHAIVKGLRQNPVIDYRRLGHHTTQCRRTTRSAGNPR